MRKNSKTEFETQTMSVNESVIGEQLIFDQAEDIIDGLQEGVQNGADAPGSEHVHVVVQPEQGRSYVWDDGDGMDLGDGEMRKFIAVLGNSTKKNDPDSVGQFGVGFAQMMAKGIVTVRTQDWEVIWDARTDPIMSYEIRQVDEYFDGFWVEIEHYEGENPDPDSHEWEEMITSLKTRFQFFEIIKDVQVTVNGERVSDKAPEDQYLGEPDIVAETDTAVYALGAKDRDRVKVYSAGLSVGWRSANGLYGYIVTKENCDLNLSRDTIKSGCDIWSQCKSEMSDFRIEILKDTSDEAITESGRKAMIRLMRQDPQSNVNRFRDREIIKMANGRTLSYSELNSYDQISIASDDDPSADSLIERGYVVLREADAAVQELVKAQHKGELKMPDSTDVREVAKGEGIELELEIVEDRSEWPRTKMGLARVLSNKIEYTIREQKREIVFGKDDAANAWTKGTGTFIALTESAMEGSAWKVFLPQIWRILCHEYAHCDDDTNNMAHSEKFNETFRNNIDKTEQDLVDLIEEIEDKGLFQTLRDSEVDFNQFR